MGILGVETGEMSTFGRKSDAKIQKAMMSWAGVCGSTKRAGEALSENTSVPALKCRQRPVQRLFYQQEISPLVGDRRRSIDGFATLRTS